MQAQKMMGYDVPGDEKIAVTSRDWNSMKLAMWRSKVSWEIAMRQAEALLEACEHADGCPGASDEREPCLDLRPVTRLPGRFDFWLTMVGIYAVMMRLIPIFWIRRRLIVARDNAEARSHRARTKMVGKTCPDRELRMSALVILNAGRQCAFEARKPDAPYYAPSREYYSDVIAALGAAQAELEALRANGTKSTSGPIASS